MLIKDKVQFPWVCTYYYLVLLLVLDHHVAAREQGIIIGGFWLQLAWLKD